MSTATTRKTALGAIGLAVAATLTLSGCKSGNEDAAPAAPSSAAPSSPTASSPAGGYAEPSTTAGPSAAGSAAPAGAGGTAKPGQSFKIGEPATVPFTYGTTTSGTIALTVTSVEQGQAADLDSLKLGDKVKGMVPYYVHYTVKNVGTTDLAYASVGHMKGLLPDGSEADGVSVIGTFEKCKDESLPKGFTNGQSQTNCAIALAPSAQVKVVGGEYWGEPYSTVGKKALTWK